MVLQKINNFFLIKKKNNIRRIIRGYHNFKKSNKLYIFRKIKGEATNIKFDFDKSYLSILKIFYKEFRIIDLDIAFAQFVFQKISFRNLNKKICQNFFIKSSITYPLPKEYINLLKKNNIFINPKQSTILWKFYCLLLWFYGNFTILVIFMKSLKNIFSKMTKCDLFFIQIKKQNLPFRSKLSSRKSYDLCSWFINYFSKEGTYVKNVSYDNRKINSFSHDDINFYSSDLPYFYIKDIISLIKFIFDGLVLSIVSLIFLIIGRWHSSFFLSEIFKTIAFKKCNKNKISKNYLFHFSETIYKPLWTYLAKQFDINVILYFYSTYDAPSDKKNSDIDRSYEFGNFNWNHVLVWDDKQENLLKKFINKSSKDIKIKIVGPIWFNDMNFNLDNKKFFRVLIFDMEIQRQSLHFGWGEIAEYNNYKPNFNIKFLSDIISVFKNKNVQFLLKRKRRIGKNVASNYSKLIKKFSEKYNFIEINQDTSPKYLIEVSDLIITAPFTSANLYKKDLLKNNIYYDPVNYVEENDAAARNILILKGLNELKRFEENIDYEYK